MRAFIQEAFSGTLKDFVESSGASSSFHVDLCGALSEWVDGFLSRVRKDIHGADYISFFKQHEDAVRQGGVLYRFVTLKPAQISKLKKNKPVTVVEGESSSWSRSIVSLKNMLEKAYTRTTKTSGVIIKANISVDDVIIDVQATAKKLRCKAGQGRSQPSETDEVIVVGTTRVIRSNDIVTFVKIDKKYGEDPEIEYVDEIISEDRKQVNKKINVYGSHPSITPEVIEKAIEERNEARCDAGGGQCGLVSEALTVVIPGSGQCCGHIKLKDGKVIEGHCWIVLSDWTIFDATSDQFGNRWLGDMAIITPDDPHYDNYLTDDDDTMGASYAFSDLVAFMKSRKRKASRMWSATGDKEREAWRSWWTDSSRKPVFKSKPKADHRRKT